MKEINGFGVEEIINIIFGSLFCIGLYYLVFGTNFYSKSNKIVFWLGYCSPLILVIYYNLGEREKKPDQLGVPVTTKFKDTLTVVFLSVVATISAGPFLGLLFVSFVSLLTEGVECEIPSLPTKYCYQLLEKSFS